MKRWIVVPLLAALATAIACGGDSSPRSPVAPPPPTPAPPPPPPPTTTAEPVVLRTATFRSANGYRTQGTATIVQEGTSYRLELKDDFRTSNSGGLDVRLCNQPQCTGAFLDLGPIASVRGAQRYNLADAGTAYGQVVIWCRGARLAFGFGNLQ